jgi:hypothetical protein
MIAVIATLLAAWIFGRALWLMYIVPHPPAAPAAGAAPGGHTALDEGPAEPPTDSPIATPEGRPPLPVPLHPRET